jgi:hypothetical protein
MRIYIYITILNCDARLHAYTYRIKNEHSNIKYMLLYFQKTVEIAQPILILHPLTRNRNSPLFPFFTCQNTY